MSAKAGTIVVHPGRRQRPWMLGLIVTIAVVITVLTFVGVASVVSEQPVVEETSVVVPIFAGGAIHAGGWEDRPPAYGGTFEKPTASEASVYGRTLDQTVHQRG